MTDEILNKLGDQIDQTIETIEFMRLEIEELKEANRKLEEKNQTLEADYSELKSKHSSWEQNLSVMLDKLDRSSSKSNNIESTIKQEEPEYA